MIRISAHHAALKDTEALQEEKAGIPPICLGLAISKVWNVIGSLTVLRRHQLESQRMSIQNLMISIALLKFYVYTHIHYIHM